MLLTTIYMWVCVAIAGTALSFSWAALLDDRSGASLDEMLLALHECAAAPDAAEYSRTSSGADDAPKARARGAARAEVRCMMGTRTLARLDGALVAARRRLWCSLGGTAVTLVVGGAIMSWLEPTWDFGQSVYWATEVRVVSCFLSCETNYQ